MSRVSAEEPFHCFQCLIKAYLPNTNQYFSWWAGTVKNPD